MVTADESEELLLGDTEMCRVLKKCSLVVRRFQIPTVLKSCISYWGL